MVKKLFIGATGQNVGKTTFSLGFIKCLIEKGMKVGFIKPMGQRYINIDGNNIDEDSVLIKEVCGLDISLPNLSPVAMEKGLSEKYTLKPNRKLLEKKIMDSFKVVSKGKDIVVIEGTGHGGVGSVFDFSNADIAKYLKAKVLIVTEGGLGRSIDRLVLNQAIYDINKVPIMGVVVNKVFVKKMDKIKRVLPRAIKRKGLKEFGFMPFMSVLSSPSLFQIKEALNADLINEGHGLNDSVANFVVGAMAAHNALVHFVSNVVIITPGDRDDLLLAAMSKYFTNKQEKAKTISGIVVTGGISPRSSIVELTKKTGVPMILSHYDTYNTATKIQKLIVKILPNEKKKINASYEIVKDNVNINGILRAL